MALSLNTQDESPPSRSSGLCAVCLRSMPLRKDGAVRVHGPVVCRCPGSGKRPRSAPPDMSPGPTTPQPSSCSQHPTAPSTSPGVSLLPRIRLLKRLPLASRDHAASKLSTVLEEVNRSNNVSAWIRLLNFPRRCFRVPGRGGRRWNLARLVNQQVAEENEDSAGRQLLQAVPDLCKVKPENATLLGAPIGQLNSITALEGTRCWKQRGTISRSFSTMSSPVTPRRLPFSFTGQPYNLLKEFSRGTLWDPSFFA